MEFNPTEVWANKYEGEQNPLLFPDWKNVRSTRLKGREANQIEKG